MIGTHIETNNTVQICEGLDDNLPHVKVSALEKLLYRNFFATLGLDLELGSKSITSPETSPVCSGERHNSYQTGGGLRQSGSSEFLIAAGPHASFGLYVTTSPDAL